MLCPFCPLGSHRSQKREMWVLWTFSGRPIYSHLALGGKVMHWDGREWSQKSAENWGSQWYAHSDQWANTGHENKKCGFCARFQGSPSIHIWPQGAG